MPLVSASSNDLSKSSSSVVALFIAFITVLVSASFRLASATLLPNSTFPSSVKLN